MPDGAKNITALGSGLTLSDGRGYSRAQRPSVFVTADHKWQAEISGVENGCVVRSWVGPVFDRKADALAAAEAKFGEA